MRNRNYFENGNRIEIVIVIYENRIRNLKKIYFLNGNYENFAPFVG